MTGVIPRLNFNKSIPNSIASAALSSDAKGEGGKNEGVNQILLSARGALLNKRELDKRESFREVVADYPKVKSQRKIIYKQFDNDQRRQQELST